MARIVTALYENRAAAERAKKALRALGVPANHIVLHEESRHRTTPATDDAIGGEPGLPSLLDAFFLPPDDYAAHQEAMRRGGVVVSARVKASEAPAIRRALDEAGAQDLDAKEQRWRAQGWSPAAAAGATPGGAVPGGPGMPGAGGMDAEAARKLGSTPATPPGGAEAGAVLQREPVGGPARSYVIQTPLAEQPDPSIKPERGRYDDRD
jgi:hypothetical protein